MDPDRERILQRKAADHAGSRRLDAIARSEIRPTIPARMTSRQVSKKTGACVVSVGDVRG
jgi:hypothetical protein